MDDFHFRGAIFDLDGTLLDSMHIWPDIDVEFLRRRGIFAVPPDYSEALSSLSFRETAEYTIRRFQLPEQPEDLMHEWNQMAIDAYSHQVQLKPHAKEYLQFLREKGVHLGICTALSKKLYVPSLQHHQIFDWFDTIVSTDDVNKGKSYPEPYLLTAARLGLSPEDCVVFEDIPEAVSGALQARMRVCGVYDESSKNKVEQMQLLCHKFIYDFGELLP
ncbi:MAG: HAD family phosphatase [Oscillospiraceae bacterium]|nr:HAD family phosphatase [Oscillospiraceae bacterium]